eukprot:8501147-Ditylum_brightwellii.AAC.1
MDILKDAVPKSWQGGMRRQRFDCATKGQAKFIQFCKCLESLYPPKQGQKGRQDTMSATGTWQKILRRERGWEADAPSLTENQVHQKVAKFCMLHSRGGQMTNECEVLKKHVKGLQNEAEKNTQSGWANGNGC